MQASPPKSHTIAGIRGFRAQGPYRTSTKTYHNRPSALKAFYSLQRQLGSRHVSIDCYYNTCIIRVRLPL